MNMSQIAGLDDVIKAVASHCFQFTPQRSELYRDEFASITNQHLPRMSRVDAIVRSHALEIVFSFKDDAIIDFREAMSSRLAGFFAPVMTEVLWQDRRLRWAVLGRELPHSVVSKTPLNLPIQLH